jgi:hypothetical protein
MRPRGGDRGRKAKPVPGPHHQVYGFLTTSPNGVVEPIHPKAMPVILTTDEERDVPGCAHHGTKGMATATGWNLRGAPFS